MTPARRPKVLVVTRLFPSASFPTLGTFVMERVRALAEHADVRVMVPTPWFPRGVPAPREWRLWGDVEHHRVLDDGVRVTYPRYLLIPKVATFLQGLSMARAIASHVDTAYRDWRPDAIDAHFAFPDGYAAVRLGAHLGCPVVVTCHGADLRAYDGHPFVDAMLRWTMQTADRVISVSSDLRQRSIARGCPEERAVFLTNGVDPGKFALRPQAECRAQLGLPATGRIGVYVGYLIDRKNQSLIVRAVAEIRRLGGPVPLIALVGDGPNRKRLEREIAAFGLEDRVRLIGSVPHEQVAVWMAAADWLLLSSDYEGWATVYFEAMACGRPVLTSNVSAARDAICDPAYGTVVEPTTAEAFAAAMIAASGTTFDAQRIRAYAESHSWANWATQSMAILQTAIATVAGPGRARSP